MPKPKPSKFLKQNELVKSNLAEETPSITVGNGFIGFKDKEGIDYSPFYKRILARFADFFLVILIFFIISGFVSTFALSFAPKDSQQFLNNQFNNQDVSLNQTEKLLSCDVDSSQKDICKKTLPYLAWINFYNIITLLVIHTIYFSVLTKTKFNTIGKKIFKIKVVGVNNKNISWVQSIAREIIWMLTFLFLAISYLVPIFSNVVIFLSWLQILSFVLILTRSTKMGVHDSIAQTIVLKN